MQVGLTVLGGDLTDERVASATRELLKEVRGEADPQARLVTREGEPNSKGDLLSLGEIALELVKGGPISKLVEGLFAFLNRNAKLDIEVENATGQKLKLNMEFVNHHGTETAFALIETFLRKEA